MTLAVREGSAVAEVVTTTTDPIRLDIGAGAIEPTRWATVVGAMLSAPHEGLMGDVHGSRRMSSTSVT